MKRPSETGPSDRASNPPGDAVLLQVQQVGDDVALVLGRDVQVVEDRHVLRAGDHGLVDVERRWCLSSAGAYLPSVSAPPAPATLWHIAQLMRNSSAPWAASPSPSSVLSARGTPGPGASDCDVGGRAAAICSSVNCARLLRRLRALHLQRHAAGADLEVDGGCADAVERRAVVGALERRGRGRSRSSPGRASCPPRRSARLYGRLSCRWPPSPRRRRRRRRR